MLQAHPFLSHLVALLSVYELQPTVASTAGTPGIPLPRYEGPTDWQTDAIERSLGVIANRMRSAEEKQGVAHPWQPRNPLLRNDSNNDDSSSSAGITPTGKGKTASDGDPFHLQTFNGERPTAGSQTALARNFSVKYPRAPSPMQISLEGLQSVADPNTLNVDRSTDPSSPSSHIPSPYPCPTCGRPATMNKFGNVTATNTGSSSFHGSPNGSPLVVPPGPLSAAAFESGLSAVEELRLLKAQVQDVARVCKAVADGDLTQKITVPVQGPVMVQLKDVINTMVDKLGQFAKEVTRVSLEVGTEGRLGGQAVVVGVQGKWQELTDVVNRLAANLSTQVRSIAIVTTAVARGDLSQMIEVDAKGEILELKVRIHLNIMPCSNSALTEYGQSHGGSASGAGG